MIKVIVYAAIYAVISGYGLYKIKLIEHIYPISTNLILGVVFYGLGFLLWLMMLKHYPLSVAYPIATGSLLIATQLIGAFMLSENFSAMKLIGTGLILVGIVCVSIQQGS